MFNRAAYVLSLALSAGISSLSCGQGITLVHQDGRTYIKVCDATACHLVEVLGVPQPALPAVVTPIQAAPVVYTAPPVTYYAPPVQYAAPAYYSQPRATYYAAPARSYYRSAPVFQPSYQPAYAPSFGGYMGASGACGPACCAPGG